MVANASGPGAWTLVVDPGGEARVIWEDSMSDKCSPTPVTRTDVVDRTAPQPDQDGATYLDAYRFARDAAAREAERQNDLAWEYQKLAELARARAARMIEQVNEDVPLAADEPAPPTFR